MPRNGPRRGDDKKENDLRRISELRLQGLTQTQIAEQVGITQRQVSNDLKTVRQRWQQEQSGNIHLWICEQISYYERLLATAQQAWELSLTDAVSEARETGLTPKGEIDKMITKKSPGRGNPAYLTQIDSCLRQIARLRGIDVHLKYLDTDRAVGAVFAAGYQVVDPRTNEPVPVPVFEIDGELENS